jgi:hypothetical protein
MAAHAFSIGEKVTFDPGAGDMRQLRGSYTVVRTMPSETRDRQYRVKSDFDGHERVVLESQLTPAAPSRAAAAGLAPGPWPAKAKAS